MLDLGWPELLVVALVLIIVVGPKDLPGMLRTFGRTTRKLRSMAGEFRSQFDEALKEAELGDVKDVLNEARQLNPTNILKDVVDPIKDAGKEIKSDLDKVMNEPVASPAEGKPETSAKDKPKATETKAGKPAAKTAAKTRKPAATASKTAATKTSNGKASAAAAKKTASRQSTAKSKPAKATAAKANRAAKTSAATKRTAAAKKPAGTGAAASKSAKTAKTSGDSA